MTKSKKKHSKINLLAWIMLLMFAITGCKKDIPENLVLLKGTVIPVKGSKSANYESGQHFIVLAINSVSDIYAGETDEDSVFEIIVPEQDNYSIYFFSSANQFIGALEFNKQVISLKAEYKTINLGNITVQNGTALSSNEQNLIDISVISDFQSPEDIIFDNNTTRICSFFYNPMNEGDITIYQGCGDCDPYEIGNRLRMSLCLHEYDNKLNRMVSSIQHYILIPGASDNQITVQLHDKIYWYVTSKGMVQYKIQRSSGIVEDGAGEIPGFLEVGKTYSSNNSSITIINPFNNIRFPTLSEIACNGFVFMLKAGNDTRYNWIAKDIGEVLYTNTNSNIDIGNNITMKVVFKKTGTRTFGNIPSWLTDEFLQNLPDESDFIPENKNIISLFNRESYLPIINGATWTYDNGATVKVSNIDNVNNTFQIQNTGNTGYFEGFAEENDLGHYIDIKSFSFTEFLPVAYEMGYRPLIYENSRIFTGLKWQTTSTSNSDKVITRISYESLDTDITTPGGQVYNDCLVIKCVYEYPPNPPSTEVTHYIKKGIGFVQKITRDLINNVSTTRYLVSYSI